MTKLHRYYLDIARDAGLEGVRLKTGGKHPKIVGEIDGRVCTYPVGNSKPSDWRSIRNTVTGLRRKIGALMLGGE